MLVEDRATVSVYPVRTEADYDAAIEEIEELWGSAEGTPERDRLDILVDLVETYETRHHPIGFPDPIEAIKVRMEDKGLLREDLGQIIGAGSGRVSEILGRKRRLTLEMIRTLAPALGLSHACLCQAYELSLDQ